MARVATSRGTRLPYLGYHSSKKYHRSAAGIDFQSRLSPLVFGTHTRPPSPRADSDIRRSLSSPGIEVGCTWMNSPFAYAAPCWYSADCAEPVQTTELVLLPKMAPI